MLEYSIVAGITASGADAYMLHVTTTPSVSYVTRQDEFDCGIMITASHNPFYDNGIKVINRYGEKLDDQTTALIEAYIDGDMNTLGVATPDLPLAQKEKIGCIVDYVSGRNRYMGYLISLASNSYKSLKIGLDCANGASWIIAKSVFGALGAQMEIIGAEPDGHLRYASIITQQSLCLAERYDGCVGVILVDVVGPHNPLRLHRVATYGQNGRESCAVYGKQLHLAAEVVHREPQVVHHTTRHHHITLVEAELSCRNTFGDGEGVGVVVVNALELHYCSSAVILHHSSLFQSEREGLNTFGFGYLRRGQLLYGKRCTGRWSDCKVGVDGAIKRTYHTLQAVEYRHHHYQRRNGHSHCHDANPCYVVNHRVRPTRVEVTTSYEKF